MPIIVYDLDDTLFPEKSFAFSGFEAVASWLEKNCKIGGFLPLIKDLYESGCRDNLFNRTLDTMAIYYTPQIISDMVRVNRNHQPNIELYDDAANIIQFCSDNKIPQAIITDGLPATQMNKIKSLKLDLAIDYILCTGSLGSAYWKPSSVPYRNVMQQFKNTDPSEFIYIGDNLLKDFLAPKKLGWATYWISRKKDSLHKKTLPTKYLAQTKIESLNDLIDILSPLEKNSTESLTSLPNNNLL